MAQKIRIIGVTMDLGQSRRGVDMGPSALRVAGLQSRLKQLGHTVEDIGNVHCMPLASLVGYGAPELVELLGFKPKVEPRSVSIVGVRDLDAKERRLVKDSGVHAFTMRDIDERGMRDVMTEALRFARDDTEGIAVSVDMDLIDPADAPGVGTPVRGGITYREAHLAMEMIADSEAMASLEIVEINPVIDLHNKTALMGVEMVLSALGKKIL